MAFRKKLLNGMRTTGDRVKKTRFYVMKSGEWVADNASALMDLLSTDVRTGTSSVSARNAAVDITHGVEDSPCLILDTGGRFYAI
jgi:hypothetical protein